MKELLLKLKLQYFGHLIQRADSLEKTLVLGKTEGKRKTEHQRMIRLDSITNSVAMNLSKLQEGKVPDEPGQTVGASTGRLGRTELGPGAGKKFQGWL